MDSTEPHDFEVIASPKAENNTTANATQDEVDNGQKSIRDLFGKADKPLIVQSLAKIVIFSSIPFLMAWSVMAAFIVSACQLKLENDGPSNEVMMQKLHEHTQERLVQCRKCLTWVDDEMPQVLEK